jgi:hypothetical protein
MPRNTARHAPQHPTAPPVRWTLVLSAHAGWETAWVSNRHHASAMAPSHAVIATDEQLWFDKL